MPRHTTTQEGFLNRTWDNRIPLTQNKGKMGGKGGVPGEHGTLQLLYVATGVSVSQVANSVKSGKKPIVVSTGISGYRYIIRLNNQLTGILIRLNHQSTGIFGYTYRHHAMPPSIPRLSYGATSPRCGGPHTLRPFRTWSARSFPRLIPNGTPLPVGVGTLPIYLTT